MKYLIVQNWNNTNGNHAGMKHMCDLLVAKYPMDYEMYVKECPKVWDIPKTFWGRLQWYLYKGYAQKKNIYDIYPQEYIELCQPMFYKLKNEDEVFLLEYLVPWTPQYELACYIRHHFPDVRIYALSHLTGKYFDSMTVKDPNLITKWASPIDKMLTLGLSLSKYFERAGIPKEKISTGFHYVDSDYYHKHMELTVQSPLRIITMGALQRDYSLLAEVVRRCSDVHWIICKGRKDVGDIFPNTPNVELKGFMEEDELRHQMEIADVSLNVMEDTVGSNVITTSMAMGLAMIVTDVGSIRDYCDDSNALFCQNNVDSIVAVINKIVSNRDMIYKMKESSIKKSLDLSIEKIDKWFANISHEFIEE